MKKASPWIFCFLVSICLFSCKGYIKINESSHHKMGSHDVTIKPGVSMSSSSSMTSGSNSEYTFEAGGTSITIKNEELTVNNDYYGKLNLNESILIEDGVVSIEGKIREPLLNRPPPTPEADETSSAVQITPPLPGSNPTAKPVLGKPGFVYNPWTHNIVDVHGIPSGDLVRDPEDSDPEHKFRAP